MGDTFESKGGEQNIAQGKNAIGKQENNFFLRLWRGIFTQGNQSPAIHAGGDVTVTYGMSPEDAAKLARELVGPQLEAKDEQIKALTEAITALSKTGAPAASINVALQELKKGNTGQAQAIFAEVLRSKEAEGQKANKAAAAMHLGAFAFMGNTKVALAAYQKAVALDPDNANGWNKLGLLLERTGELDKAEQAYRKVLALSESRQDKTLLVWAYGNLGKLYGIRGDIEQAEQMFKKSLEISEALGLKETTARTYGNLGVVYKTRGELAQAEQMHKRAYFCFKK